MIETQPLGRGVRDTTRSFNVTNWLIAISIGLLTVNVALFVAYKQDTPDGTLWEYFESETFRLLTATLALPIILLLLENHFNLIKGLLESRQEKERREIEERNERRKRLEQERREKRLQAIEKTTDVLKQINGSISKLRFIDSIDHPNNNKDGKYPSSNLSDIRMEIADLSILVQEMINIWTFRFPVLPGSTYALFADYVRVLYWSGWAVAHCIQNNLVRNPKHLQEQLGLIQRGMISLAFHPIFNSLNLSASLLESIEEVSRELSKDMMDESTTRQHEIQRIIIDKIKFKIDENIKKSFENDEPKNSEPKSKMLEIVEEANKADNGNPPLPITVIWRIREKKRKDIISQISKSVLDSITEDFPTIEKIKEDSQESPEKKTDSVDFRNHTFKTMKDDIERLVEDLLKLKVYQMVLQIEPFTRQEILPVIQTFEAEDVKDPGTKSQALKDYIEEDRERLKIVRDLRTKSQALKDYIEEDRERLKIESSRFEEVFKSRPYKEFSKSLFDISDLALLDVIAIDMTTRIAKMAKLMRFLHVVPMEDDISAVR